MPTYTAPFRGAGFTVSATGLLAYETGATGGQVRLVWKDRTGTTLGNLGDALTAVIRGAALSPDGQSLAVDLREGAGADKGDLWTYDFTRGIRTRFTFDPAFDDRPVG